MPKKANQSSNREPPGLIPYALTTLSLLPLLLTVLYFNMNGFFRWIRLIAEIVKIKDLYQWNSRKFYECSIRKMCILQVLAIEFVLLAIDFVLLANEFVLLANEFVPLAIEFVPLAIEFVLLEIEFVTLAIEFVTLAGNFVILEPSLVITRLTRIALSYSPELLR